MGVTLSSPNLSDDMSYGGFMKLRTLIAHCLDPQVSTLYDEMHESLGMWDEEFCEKYNEKVNIMADALPSDKAAVVDFLYAPDCEGSCKPSACATIANLIEPHLHEHGEVIYGYIARPDAFTLRDFYAILRDCVDTNKEMTWI